MITLKKFLTGLLASLAASGSADGAKLTEGVRLHSAKARIVHCRPRELTADGQPAYRDDNGALVAGRRWITDPDTLAQVPDPRDVVVLSDEISTNVKTTAGIDFIFSQSYNSTAAAQTNGLAWIALSNDTLTETSGSTTLSNEIAVNGLSRTKGTYAHTNGASTATITNTFTASGAQSAQKAALFSAASTGTMNHVLSFTQRSLQTNDTLAITFTITIS